VYPHHIFILHRILNQRSSWPSSFNLSPRREWIEKKDGPCYLSCFALFWFYTGILTGDKQGLSKLELTGGWSPLWEIGQHVQAQQPSRLALCIATPTKNYSLLSFLFVTF
jgi:hypothetical protein